MRWGWILLPLCCFPPIAFAEELPAVASPDRKIVNFALRDSTGKRVSLADFKEHSLKVVMFLGVECPLVKLYGPRLQKLANEYRDRGVAFLAIDPNRQDDLADLAAFVTRHKLDYPVLKDPTNRVADMFGATRMSEVFVIDQELAVRYHGRIDDQYGPGFARPKPQREDLREALDELLANQPVSLPHTEVTGCLLGRTRVPDSKCTVTYSTQIAAILNRRCVECHRPGEIGPFSLTDYNEVVGWADMISEVVADGRMPPWHASPEHGQFEGDRRLTDEEKKLIRDWAAAGAPKGDGKLPASPDFLASSWQMSREPDLIVPMRETPYTVCAEGVLEYQFFVVDPNFNEERWVTEAQVLPGNRSLVHHVTVFAFAGSPEQALRDGTTDGYLATYVPGLRPTLYPKGMAKRVVAGSKIVFQIHYTPTGTEQTDTTRLGLVFANSDDIRYEVVTGSVLNRSFVIPAGASRYCVTADSIRSPRASRLLGLMPHMHSRGASFRFEAEYPDGSTEILLDVPRYDFNWQTSYRLLKPRMLPGGTRLHCVAHFDNSANNKSNPNPSVDVRNGIQSRDEMMLGYFDVAVPRDTKMPRKTTAKPTNAALSMPKAAIPRRSH